MSLTALRRHYGLQEPFDFRVAVPFLSSLLVMIVALVAAIVLFMIGDLRIGTERFQFFVYIICSLLVAAACSRARIISLIILVWCTIDLGLALSHSALEQRFGPRFPPLDIFTERRSSSSQYVYHPYLQYALRPSIELKGYMDVRNRNFHESLYQNFYNWPKIEADKEQENDKNFRILHNSLGLRGTELSASDLNKPLIFVYGGSTTYDVGVTQGQTWVERLQGDLGNRFTLLNFGVPGYSTTEHLIQTAFYQGIVGKRPTCAIYYIGANDIHTAHAEKLDPSYADLHALLVIRLAHKPTRWAARYSPLLALLDIAGQRMFDSLPQGPNIKGKQPGSGSDPRLEKVFIEHVSTIADMNNARGVKSVFIGQIQNLDLFRQKPQAGNRLAPLVRNQDVWPLQQRFNSILKTAAAAHAAGYIDVPIAEFTPDDFVDQWHFSSSGSSKFARLITRQVDDYCQ